MEGTDRHRRTRLVACALLAAALASGCQGTADVGSGVTGTPAPATLSAGETPTPTPTPSPTSASPAPTPTTTAAPDPAYMVQAPGPLTGRPRTPDILATSTEAIPDDVLARLRKVDGVVTVLPFSLASASVDGRAVTIAAVDLAEFRPFAPPISAESDIVWQRLAAGEIAVDSSLPRRLVDAGDMMRIGTAEDAPDLHVGAYAPLVRNLQVVVNTKRGEQLGMPADNALLVSTGTRSPSDVTERLRRILGKDAALEVLATEFDVDAPQTAVLSGGSVPAAVGSFTYTNRGNGEISPDPAWVEDYIRTESVPILGQVTCNKAVLPQLRAALVEIVQRGLASEIHPDEYQGCYYPRYIGRDPSNGLSLHSWGIALDLNTPGNQRGTVGEMSREVVAIFKKWGFAWGGDWNWTDPMHFEMNAVVRVG